MKRAFADLPSDLRDYWRFVSVQANKLLTAQERERVRRFEASVASMFKDGYEAHADEKPVVVIPDLADVILLTLVGYKPSP